MLILPLNEGPVLLTGDAVVHSDWLHSDDVQRITVDANRAAVVRNQVRSFLDTTPNSSIAYGHDLRGIDCERHDIVCHRSEKFYPEGDNISNP
jgi:N-acyl homoserine lactone hydrolase